MTGPEHYREAERLLDAATDNDGDIQTDDGMTANILSAAQVHATLAHAGATAEQVATIQLHMLGGTSLTVEEWAEALAKSPEEAGR